MLWLCLHLPDLPLEIFTRSDPAPEALVLVHGSGHGHGRCVALCDAVARRYGIRSGMSLNAAHALASSLRVRERDEESERAALERLAAWAGQFTSIVDLLPQALLLEVARSRRLFGSLERLREAVRQGVTELGYRAYLAIAPTPLAAAWLARVNREECITRQEVLPSVLAPLPLACLDLTSKQSETLHGMGVRAIGDCLRLPRDGLARRLGPGLVRLLDRALGRVPDPRAAFVVPFVFESRVALPAAVNTAEGLLFPLRRLLLELEGFLRARNAGTRAMELSLLHSATVVTKVELELVTPSRDAVYLATLLRERLEHVVLPSPVEEVALRVADPCTLASHNLDFFISQGMADETLIERLRARLGKDAVRGLCQREEHRPERAWGYAEPGVVSETRNRPGRRPLWLLRKPLLLEVRNEHPCLDGALLLKPGWERIESGWWDGQDVARDYFIARSVHGAQLWVYRELRGERRWFLHGIFS
ncbi:MAG: Y-family DNA polymerase [Acidiferrobacterales bacterium]